MKMEGRTNMVIVRFPYSHTFTCVEELPIEKFKCKQQESMLVGKEESTNNYEQIILRKENICCINKRREGYNYNQALSLKATF